MYRILFEHFRIHKVHIDFINLRMRTLLTLQYWKYSDWQINYAYTCPYLLRRYGSARARIRVCVCNVQNNTKTRSILIFSSKIRSTSAFVYRTQLLAFLVLSQSDIYVSFGDQNVYTLKAIRKLIVFNKGLLSACNWLV